MKAPAFKFKCSILIMAYIVAGLILAGSDIEILTPGSGGARFGHSYPDGSFIVQNPPNPEPAPRGMVPPLPNIGSGYSYGYQDRGTTIILNPNGQTSYGYELPNSK